jgi:hypothetical protein
VDGKVPGASTIISDDAHPARTWSIASASARSMVSPYSRRTWMVRATYQHRFRSGIHSAASFRVVAIHACETDHGGPPAQVVNPVTS